MTLVFGGREKPFGAKRCSCAKAQEYWRKRDERVRNEEVSRLEAERRERIDKLFKQSLLPARWRTRTFESFQACQQNREAYLAAMNYATRFTREMSNGLIFSGAVGRGKTHLCAAVANMLLNNGHSVVFGTVTSLLAQIRNTFDSNKETEQMAFNRLARCQLLIIDDLGKEKVKEWTEQTLYELIDTRYGARRPILVTTNMDIFKLTDKYKQNGDAILSRLLETCRGIEVQGEDWRKRALHSD